jgi:hypothetical protein
MAVLGDQYKKNAPGLSTGRMMVQPKLKRGLRARRHVAADGRELRLDGVGNGRHGGDQGKAHGSSDQAVFDSSCASIVVQELLHGFSPLRFKFALPIAAPEIVCRANMTCG